MVWRWREAERPTGPAAGALRREGVIRGIVGVAIGTAILLWWHLLLAVVVFAVAGLTTLAALLSPGRLYRRLHRATEILGHWIGLAIGWLLLPLLFFLVITPLALLMRLGNPDRLSQRRDPEAGSYWTSREDQPRRDRDFYQRQF